MKDRVAVIVILSFAVSAIGAAAADSPARRWTPPDIASDQYDSSPSFSPDGRELLFMRSDTNFRNYRILWSRCEQGAWTPPQDAPFSAPPPALEADPYFTADGKRVYYVSSRQDSTHEDLDIWVVDRNADGSWAQPLRLPEPVNSTSAELLPRLTTDGRLYFGSSRPGGFGQSDIYVATPGADGSWRVDNLGPPVSTAANEYEAEISADGNTLIVVADRGDRSHLYRYVRQGEGWTERGRIPARPDVFQVGPLLSPRADRLLFAQQDEDAGRSGEIFLIDLSPAPDESWPPRCINEADPTDRGQRKK